MKKSLLISSLVITLYSGKCLGYQSIFGQDSTSWTILYAIIDGGMTDQYQTFTGLDSTMNGHVYKKVFIYGNQLTGLIREDTSSGQAWYFRAGSQNESLIYDLSLQLNDSFMIYASMFDSIEVHVDSVYFLNGLKHLRFDIDNFYFLSKFEFIEGTGTTAGINYQYETGLPYLSKQLLCKFDDTTQVYTSPDWNGECFVTLIGVPEFSVQTKSEVFPNPVQPNGILTIRNDNDPVLSITIFDLLGKIVNRTNTDQFIVSQPSGTYFLKIIHRSGKIEQVKVIVDSE